ncbi:hypothetical protein HPP92_001495 [Vanilla planifolia]|uniref:DNA primase small subunit n=1 Tax=Vanilla planifolia TaxID=51239 RepID=A0A835SCT8_VANPL|nr:hypothetical protein HPP92_001495 [Vanilla planifolia]
MCWQLYQMEIVPCYDKGGECIDRSVLDETRSSKMNLANDELKVSKHMNHLLKAPFCVHPKTGRVCVPIDPQHCDSFDPTAVPTLSKLLEELNTGGWKADTENGLCSEK